MELGSDLCQTLIKNSNPINAGQKKQSLAKDKQGNLLELPTEMHVFKDFDIDTMPYILEDDGRVFDSRMKEWVAKLEKLNNCHILAVIDT